MKKLTSLVTSILLVQSSFGAGDYHPPMDERAKQIPVKEDFFRPPPVIDTYDAQAQWDIYGAKKAIDTTWQFHLFGREMYPLGELGESMSFLGKKNLVYPRAEAFGDLRIAGAVNEDAVDRKSELKTRLNLDIDVAITATERIHAFFRPLDEDGDFTGFEWGQEDRNRDSEAFLDGKADALFFEGDIGYILSGITGEWAGFELPFAVGLMPLIFHNGIWFNDAVTGEAFSISAQHSNLFDISNYDVSFFHAFDQINTAINADDDQAQIAGFNAFIEGWEGYLEIGYGYTFDESRTNDNQDYHNIAVSYSHRFRDIASLSYRVIANVGQEVNPNTGLKTADGQLYLLESSFMTRAPYTLIPYANFFYGVDKPQPLAKAAGGILQNVGIVFEGDGITNFQTLDATGNQTYGGALGLEYLFQLNQQIVVEIATVQIQGERDAADRKAFDDEYGYGFRYQLPLSKEWIFRADGVYATRAGLKDLYGVRTELRFKF